MTKEKRVNIRIDDKTSDSLEKLAKEKNITVAALMREIIFNTLNPKQINKYRFLDDACPMVRYLAEEDAPKKKGEGYYCLKRAPKEDKLGGGTEKAAKNYCDVCKLREVYLEDSKILTQQRKEGIKIKMPMCTRGGIPNEDLTEMFCPKIGKYRPIYDVKEKEHKPCRLAGSNNANCFDFKLKTVVSGLKEKDNR